ncbi:MAG: cellulase family glycosylhydrolase [Bacteroidales bacterium]
MKKLFVFLPFLLLVVSCTPGPKDSYWDGQKKFTLGRGVNVGIWLSQSDVRGIERENFFTEKDVEFLASCGYDHIRLPIDEEQFWNAKGEKIDTAFTLLNNALQWCSKHHLRVLVDLHIIRSHHFLMDAPPLWTDPKEQDKFIGLWEQLSAELIKYPVNQVGYEIMNEAVAKDPEDWNKLIARTVAAIRKNEPARTIIIGSNMWQQVQTFDVLKVPEGDTNIILSFHFYSPFLFTHHTAPWTAIGDYKGPVQYPGLTIDETNLKGLPEKLVEAIRWDNKVFNRDTMEMMMMKAITKAQSLGLPLYCGEFGCLRSVDPQQRLNWFADMIAIFNKHQIGWASWEYKDQFGIVYGDYTKPDSLLIKTLLGK